MPNPARKTIASLPAGDAREVRDRRVVSGLIGIFVVGAVALLSITVAEASAESRAKAAMGQTFAVVHRRQSEFLSVTGRFATWPELRQQGVTLGARQRVNGSNADASHWFISLVDEESGLICDRIGELMDEDRFERAPVCRGTR